MTDNASRFTAARARGTPSGLESGRPPWASMPELARNVRMRSASRWGPNRTIDMVGASPAYVALQQKLQKVARYQEPVLIFGESGVGKEQLAAAIYLLGESLDRPFVSVNCPQYQDGNLTVSELFGHRKGSFTGAITDHRGAFEEADGGVLFLDEIGDLQANTQAMLLRALSTGEFRPLGAAKPRSVEVRVISATNRHLNQLVMTNQFRFDLFSRLARFQISVPTLRERQDDWLHLVEYTLAKLQQRYGVRKRLSTAAFDQLANYEWPGNVRQLISVVTTGYAMADTDVIEPPDFGVVGVDTHAEELRGSSSDELYALLYDGGVDFWTAVYRPFMNRDLNRAQVRDVIVRGLRERGSYRELLAHFHLPMSDYQRFMDFLRHHSLKS